MALDAALRAGLAAGAREFDARRWWHAHEAWEAAWRACAGPERAYLQGLIQIAAANHHLERGAAATARTLLDRGCGRMLQGRPELWPIDTGFLLCACAVLCARIEAGAAVRPMACRLGGMLGEE